MQERTMSHKSLQMQKSRECTSLCECVNCENTENSSAQQEDAIPEPMEEVETSDSENDELAMPDPDEEIDVDI